MAPAPVPVPSTPAPAPAQDQDQNQSQDPIPAKCQILVIGGGPGGSYAAAALAREGLDVVLLEAEVFPRYHIGESMLASIRHLLRFIDLDATFDAYGFTKKVGAAFKLNGRKREGFTDFLAAGGPENYAWNVVRAEADELMFRHAGKCGARVFDGVKVASIAFAAPLGSGSGSGSEAAASSVSESESGEERPVSATWTRKRSSGQGAEPETETESGSIAFDYLVDASGRAGLLSTRYLKTRTYNRGLRNVASWGYWRGAGAYARGTERANAPFFEALGDESGWAWLIPLHNGTASVGIVMNQDIATAKKKAASPAPSAREFYLEQLKLAPSLLAILHSGSGSKSSASTSAFDSTHINDSTNGKKEEAKEEKEAKEEAKEEEEESSATLVSDIKSASDYSYSASAYSTAHARIVGDAGCFIDPYFSSGVHLALASALSAATTICAALRGDCTEREAARWHDAKVGTGYTRFLMVVLSAYKQIRSQEEPVLADFDEDNFDRAFAFFRPIIQGTADVSDKLSQEELAKTLDFCAHAFEPTLPEDRASVLEKLSGASASAPAPAPASSAFPSTDHPSTANGHASTPNGGSASASSNGHANGHGHAHPVTNGTTNANGTAKPKPEPKPDTAAEFDANLSTEEQRVLRHIRARTMMRTEDTMNIASFSTDVVEGFAPRLECGVLGLRRVGA